MKYEHFVAKVQAIAKIGKKFSTDPYALENYHELDELSQQMLGELTDNKLPIIYDGLLYPTPNSSVRVLIFNSQGELLMVKERQDHGYAVPGGWCDVWHSLREAAIAEVKQETGLDVQIDRLLAIFQRERYKDYPTLISEQVHYFSATVIGGELSTCHETLEVGFHQLHDWEPLSKKNTITELSQALNIYFNQSAVHVD
jgi:8-oxo-dGTP diphosphatase